MSPNAICTLAAWITRLLKIDDHDIIGESLLDLVQKGLSLHP